MNLAATRAEALAQLEAFLPRAGADYAENRNREGTTSGLSPALKRRLISEAKVCARVVAVHGPAGEKFVQEVCWRTYWVGWLQQRPAIWQRWQADVAALETGMTGGLQRRHAAALAGATGIDAFDGWIAELRDTGWLHNHARMSFASIWIFTLGLPWQLGAALFLRQLLDACPASNTLSWRWVAGLHTAGKAYAARADLIRANSGGRFQVAAPLAREIVPLVPDTVPPPQPVAAPLPIDPDMRTGLLVTLADLSLDTLTLPPVVATAVLPGGPASDRQRAYDAAALDDALARAMATTASPGQHLDTADTVAAVRDFAARHRLQQIVTGTAPVGPVADRLAVLTPALAADGVRLVELRRAWDTVAWPRAGKGFFGFRAVIPDLLALPVAATC